MHRHPAYTEATCKSMISPSNSSNSEYGDEYGDEDDGEYRSGGGSKSIDINLNMGGGSKDESVFYQPQLVAAPYGQPPQMMDFIF